MTRHGRRTEGKRRFGALIAAALVTIIAAWAFPALALALPVNTSVPTATGTAKRASLLTTTAGSWSGVGNTYSYQWQRNTGSGFVAITGATVATYTLQPADTGADVRVQVTATNIDGSASATSAAVGPIAEAPPANTAVPVLTGVAARAYQLATTTGTWSGVGNLYSYQWQRDAGSGWTDIAGATKTAYIMQPADTGASVRVNVTATNVDDAVSAYSAAAGPVVASPPANMTGPTIVGTAARTRPLTASAGTWSGPGNTYSYQWQRNSGSGFADIAGATAASYVLASADLGATVRVKVTATNVDAAVAAYSLPSATVGTALPVQGAAPAASGTPRTGLTVSATSGTWTPAGATFAYQWQRDTGSGFADIGGATQTTYVLTDADAGARIRAEVTATNTDGSTAVNSNALGPVLSTPLANVVPTVSGTLTDASTLTATSGSWSSAGNLPHTYKYQWIRCPAAATTAASIGCIPLTGATNATYATVAADVGLRLAVRVTATNTQSIATTAASVVTDELAGRVLTNVSVPEITGDATVRSLQTAADGAWSVPLTKATYQWLRCAAGGTACVAITGATAKTYTPVVADTGKTLVVRVNATSPGRNASAESVPTAEIAALALPTADAPVTVSGIAARAQTLKAVMPVSNDYPTSFAYQWFRCDATGGNCGAITNAKGSTYILVKADEGATIRVRQNATNTTGAASSTSDPTGVVAAVLPTLSVPSAITGTGVAGAVHTASKGTWVTTTDTTYAFAWQRCAADGNGCAPIAGAVATTYKPVTADVGSTLRAVVTATNADGAVTSTSAPSATIRPAPPKANPLPVLSGSAQVGKVLTATTGTWTGTSATVRTTFWRCAATCTAIQTGTDRTYTLVTADAGLRIKASVTGVGPGGTVQTFAVAVLGPVRSATTGTVLAAAASMSLKGSTGTVLAMVAAKTPAAGGQATVTVKPAKGLKRGFRVWACPTAGTDWQPCTKPVRLGSKSARLKVAVDAGERVSVVVAKTGK